MSSSERFEPHAARAMASMFDDVSGRYDFLNRLMTLGQDAAWRDTMWRGVPDEARVVLDLCTGSGVSLPGLRRPGRTVLGVDVSVAMLQVAQVQQGGPGWSPRLACADAFRLPLRDGAIDAVTVAFGMRNLRPRPASLAEIARVLGPGGTLVVLEAAAPASGPLAPFHAFWLRTMVPLMGHLSPDPTAYRYLSESIFEFGSGVEFERDLEQAGFRVETARAFLLGATRLWVARRGGSVGQNRAMSPGSVHDATAGLADAGARAASEPAAAREARTWSLAQVATSAVLTAALVYALVQWINLNAQLPLNDAQRVMGWSLLVIGIAGFGVRTIALALRLGVTTRGR